MDTNGVINFFTTLIAILLAVAIFIFVPQKLTGMISRWVGWGETPKGQELLWFNLIEGGIRLIVFVAYMLLMALNITFSTIPTLLPASSLQSPAVVVTCAHRSFRVFGTVLWQIGTPSS